MEIGMIGENYQVKEFFSHIKYRSTRSIKNVGEIIGQNCNFSCFETPLQFVVVKRVESCQEKIISLLLFTTFTALALLQ